jgi:hypothetical protein
MMALTIQFAEADDRQNVGALARNGFEQFPQNAVEL